MTKAIPRVIWILLAAVAVSMGLFVFLGPRVKWQGWSSAAQIIAMVATVVTVVGVWSQLAVQTIIAILASFQEERIRNARGRLFRAEDESRISALPCTASGETNKWKPDWKETAEEVCQNWSSVGYILNIDPIARLLIKPYVRKSRRTILKSYFIAKPVIELRRSSGGQKDIWEDFDWLAKAAARYLEPGEAKDWKIEPVDIPK